MRIKSYFSASVQAAITLARAEFGDNITLVTSHVSSLESRHLGEYEVVFAIEEADEPSLDVAPQAKPGEQSEAGQDPFQRLLNEALSTTPSPQENAPQKLEQLRVMLIELGIEPAMVRALMTMVERCVSIPEVVATTKAQQDAATPREHPAIDAPAPELKPEVVPDALLKKDYTAAERAFVLSVAKPAQNLAAITPKWALGA